MSPRRTCQYMPVHAPHTAAVFWSHLLAQLTLHRVTTLGELKTTPTPIGPPAYRAESRMLLSCEGQLAERESNLVR